MKNQNRIHKRKNINKYKTFEKLFNPIILLLRIYPTKKIDVNENAHNRMSAGCIYI